MRTAFTPEQLADPKTAASAGAIRKCVHCGFCTATCPTYVLTGDERDSPRGRIELIREMLEGGGPPAPSTVTHIDRCLSCLACTTTCPSGVDYAQLIDHARAYIEAHHRRPWFERTLRALIPAILTRPRRLRLALFAGRLARPLGPLFERLKAPQLAALLRLVPPPAATPQVSRAARGRAKGRVVLLQGCVEPAMAPQIRAAAIRLITRAGYEVVLAEGEGCCGAISEHLGRAGEAQGMARANLSAWAKAGKIDAIVTTAAGCGTALKAYGRLLGQPGEATAAKARDVLEFIAEVGLPEVVTARRPSVAYHAACSLQHGQQIKAAPPRLLAEAGYEVRQVPEGHLCCGSAGVYNILQSAFATQLRDRKAANIRSTGATVLAAGNIGCMAQLSPVLDMPVVHPVELLDWATGGPPPPALTPAGARVSP
ncbi:glycolate oxidase subunit GlcF [Phenylobacterium sp.]|uniref:glycolate oxidase subunit GlcF n=1 Tax=Phenylobacterium sp. TaxID=1871053 RepID=UPI0025EA92C8|nr:glycolate oxidase subunit GlcF [Phenylobacterium sp.]MBX3483671.1 glycolate oxidase subunit GlcF [Phenylobacterium sp.]MCW5760926.1 glycolate oxidase subunit GlcF [Phenylobacterium sp.]